MLKQFAVSVALLASLVAAPARAETPGVTESEIKIGAVFPFSGPASPLSNTGRGLIAYVNSINDRGGINGRKINLITYDDAYTPPKAVEQVRKLIESDEVAFMFSQLGTPGIGATIKYITAKKVPDLFVVSGATKFTNFAEFPTTTTGLPSYNTEGKIYAKYIAQTAPDAKIAILYQNDDLGRDFVTAFKETLKADFDKKVVTSPYEVTEPTIDSRVVQLKASGAQAFLIAGTPKFAAQAIKKASEIGWTPLTVLNYVSSSVSSTIVPAGADKAVGVVVATIAKDPNDKKWADDPGVKWYRAHFEKYLPGADIGDSNYLFGTHQGQILEQVLKQCGNDLSRENIVKQARNIKGLTLPTLMPGITINTGPDNSMAYTQLQLQRWTGSSWEQFGGVQSADAK
ncbi:Leucine-, isoleucine-, valine-, threonine-, and alanine-binding protein [Bradyrhizobium ivorense]|uniref:Leucine-, isoleucine-, valine-, threonine-, and alanine-binding protein n=1 Tax=Bradyrhizobium ivorense TaxID=2511166 RepID=A0A508T3M2_9BRAD|nr:ABC transporter substrate-binding protein [Bradyrhizobium ivorense]VIO69483.1 Leucine-, isoleucine-, valine-, threonine-, and alanine-binding protein [Bradyrhizobium ivorense]VIO71236.1 Leucine-, isoleucine-, valine-, threonine-, and alanine-binding protein [Bradyrhizobium ivorense]